MVLTKVFLAEVRSRAQGLDYSACIISALLTLIAARMLEVIFCQNIYWDILAARSQRILYQDLILK